MNKSGRFDHFNDKCGTQAMIFFQNVHLFQHDGETEMSQQLNVVGILP